MKLSIYKKLSIKLNKNKKSYCVYLNNKLIIKQDLLNNDVSYTFFYIINLLVKLGLIKET